MITLGERIVYDNGDIMEPVLESHLERIEGDPIDPERHFREMVAEEAFPISRKLRGKIAEALERYGVTVLPQEDGKKRACRTSWRRRVGAGTSPRVGHPVLRGDLRSHRHFPRPGSASTSVCQAGSLGLCPAKLAHGSTKDRNRRREQKAVAHPRAFGRWSAPASPRCSASTSTHKSPHSRTSTSHP